MVDNRLLRMNDKRFKFFNSHVDFDYVIEINIMLDFIDCVVSRGGDVITYRVRDYGNNNFVITER